MSAYIYNRRFNPRSRRPSILPLARRVVYWSLLGIDVDLNFECARDINEVVKASVCTFIYIASLVLILFIEKKKSKINV